jgi:hypothetical protein
MSGIDPRNAEASAQRPRLRDRGDSESLSVKKSTPEELTMIDGPQGTREADSPDQSAVAENERLRLELGVACEALARIGPVTRNDAIGILNAFDRAVGAATPVSVCSLHEEFGKTIAETWSDGRRFVRRLNGNRWENVLDSVTPGSVAGMRNEVCRRLGVPNEFARDLLIDPLPDPPADGDGLSHAADIAPINPQPAGSSAAAA